MSSLDDKDKSIVHSFSYPDRHGIVRQQFVALGRNEKMDVVISGGEIDVKVSHLSATLDSMRADDDEVPEYYELCSSVREELQWFLGGIYECTDKIGRLQKEFTRLSSARKAFLRHKVLIGIVHLDKIKDEMDAWIGGQ